MSFAHAPGTRRNAPPPRSVNLVLVSGHSQVIYTDATGSRSFGSLGLSSVATTSGFLDFLDEHLDSRDAANELPDGSLPGVPARQAAVA
jgi:hypothetical protein